MKIRGGVRFPRTPEFLIRSFRRSDSGHRSYWAIGGIASGWPNAGDEELFPLFAYLHTMGQR